MRITDRQLRQIIREELIREGLKIVRVDTQEPMEVDVGQEVTLRGTGFTNGMQVTLTSPRGTKVSAENVSVTNPGTASVYIPGLPEAGSYKLAVSVGDMRGELMNALKVGVTPTGGPT